MNINELVENHVRGMEPDSILCDKGTETPQYNRDRLIEVGVYGAKAVLEEIEAVLNKGNESRCDDFFTIAEITRKIEQLKK